MTKVSIDSSIFRDYDIRGIYPTQLNEDTFYVLGKAIAAYLSVAEIAVGYDARLSSPSLFKALTKGIMDMGVRVVSLGLISTEIHYFASGKYGFPANVIISASHNPGKYNGVKIVKKGVVPLHGGFGLPEIKKYTLDQNFPVPTQKGSVTKKKILDEWIHHALTLINPKKLRPLKVVVDAGNGMGGISWEKLIGILPIEIIPLYFEPDGNFPHHLPDPLQETNLEDIKKKIIQTDADCGFALDGDADRCFVLDENAQVLTGTLTTAILAKHLLQKYGPAPILYNVVCGRIVAETVKEEGGRPIRVRVGHSFIKETMKKENALFAGEHSGHFYFRDNYFADSSLLAGLLMLEYLSIQNKPLSTVCREFDKYPQSGEKNYKVADVQKNIAELKKQFKDAQSMDELDGLSIWYKSWWCNIRASKTEPLLRLNVEADNAMILKEKLKLLEDKIGKLGGIRHT
jgi:phosphomannomutase